MILEETTAQVQAEDPAQEMANIDEFMRQEFPATLEEVLDGEPDYSNLLIIPEPL